MYMSAQLACKIFQAKKVHTPRAPPPESLRHPWENSISSFQKGTEDSPVFIKNSGTNSNLKLQEISI